ncbi:MFS-type transporter SLC18B1 isoform X3 [Ixodes scapularis]
MRLRRITSRRHTAAETAVENVNRASTDIALYQEKVTRQNKTQLEAFYSLVGLALSSLGYLLVGPAPFLHSTRHLWMVYLSQVFMGLGASAQFICGYCRALKLVLLRGYPDNIRSSGFVSSSVFTFAVFGSIVAPPAAGYLVETFGYPTGSMAMLGLLLTWVFMGLGASAQFICGYCRALKLVLLRGYPDNIRSSGFVSSSVFTFAVFGSIVAPPAAGYLVETFGYPTGSMAMLGLLLTWVRLFSGVAVYGSFGGQELERRDDSDTYVPSWSSLALPPPRSHHPTAGHSGFCEVICFHFGTTFDVWVG